MMSATQTPGCSETECKLCGCDAKLVRRSHVIPRWMYNLLPNDVRNFKTISGFEGEYEQRSQAGLYDSFVRQACENRFQVWDDYAARLLRRAPQISNAGFDFGSYDYGKLARFYLSVLWRMHACNQPLASVDLADTAAPLAEALLSHDDAALSGYEIIPTYSREFLSFAVIGPRWVEYDGTRYWKLYMPRFQVMINVSGRPGPNRCRPWLMKVGANLLMLEDTFESGEQAIALQAIVANMERKDVRRN